MNKLITIIIFGILFNITNVALASVDADAETKLLKLLEHNSNITMKFKQETYSSEQELLSTVKGKFSILRPGRLRWEIIEPSSESIEIIADGKKLWQYEPELAQAVYYDLEQYHLKDKLIALLVGNGAESLKSFKVTALNNTEFKLKPKKKDNELKEIIIYFDKHKLVTSIKITDLLLQHTKFNFKLITAEPKFAKDFFKFIPPADVDILEGAN